MLITSIACDYMKDYKLTLRMLEKSRFNRRLHRLSMLINDLFHQVGMILKELNDTTEYLLDSFPVPICDNIRIFNVRFVRLLLRTNNYNDELNWEKRN